MHIAPEHFNIVVSSDYYDQFLERLSALGDPSWKWHRVNYPGREPKFFGNLSNVDVLITREDLSVREYDEAKRLKMLQVPTAGYDHIDLKRAFGRGVPVGTNGGANSIAVAEHVVMLMLCIYRNLLFHHNAVVNGPWVNLKYSNLELAGKTLGIVGMGNVGRQLAIRARALGMRVVYYDIERADPVFETTHQVTFAAFEAVLGESDAVSFHVPLTRKTNRMINRETLAAMKNQAILINTSRGAVQDEAAIAEALASGKLKGAGLDVFNEEPLGKDSPLLAVDNVVLTPHCGPSLETQGRVLSNMVRNIDRVWRGLPPVFIARDYDIQVREESCA